MTQSPKKLSLQNFQETYKKGLQQKLLQQALVYLKLREHGCPKTRALIFAKKKQIGIDGTVTKDGPAGFRKLRPEKPQGQLNNGWVKGQKLKYEGLRGFSEQIVKNVSKQKLSITKYNKIGRAKFQQLRLKQKQQNHLIFEPNKKNKFLQQINTIKDQFSKDKEKRNLFLSYEGLRLDQYTRNYFQKIQEINPDSYVTKLGAFNNPINDQGFKMETDWQIAKGKSLSSYQMQGQKKRKDIIQFRRSLTNLQIPNKQLTKNEKKFRASLHNSNKQLLMSVSTGKNQSQSKRKNGQKQFQQFYGNLDKIIFMKTKKSMPEISGNPGYSQKQRQLINQ